MAERQEKKKGKKIAHEQERRMGVTSSNVFER